MQEKEVIEKINCGDFTHCEIKSQPGGFTIKFPHLIFAPPDNEGKEWGNWVQDMLCDGEHERIFLSEADAIQHAQRMGLNRILR